MKVTKSSGGVPRLSYTGRDDRHFLPTGLYIIKTVNGLYICWNTSRVLDLNDDSFPFVPLQNRGRWGSVKTPRRSSFITRPQKNRLIIYRQTLQLLSSASPSLYCSFTSFKLQFVERICHVIEKKYFFLLAFAILRVSSGPGWTAL